MSATAFHAAMSRLLGLALACDLTGREVRKSRAAADPASIPDFRPFGERSVPSKTDWLSASDSLDFTAHDTASGDALVVLATLTEPDGGAR